MYAAQEDVFYYLTVTNQPYAMPAMPEGVEMGVLAGMYCFEREADARINLFGSGAIMTEVREAAQLLRARGHAVNIFSVTSYNELVREALAAERRSLHAPSGTDEPYVRRLLGAERGVFIAASDYMKTLPLQISPWVPGPYVVLGTDGFGLSEARPNLRDYFEVSAPWIAYAALVALGRTLADPVAVAALDAAGFAVANALDLAKVDPAGNGRG
jgi:pyruvate dehydrogenase E1 component